MNSARCLRRVGNGDNGAEIVRGRSSEYGKQVSLFEVAKRGARCGGSGGLEGGEGGGGRGGGTFPPLRYVLPAKK